MHMKRICLSACFALTLVAPAFAWGPEGHVVVAMVAESRLSDQAKDVIREMISNVPLATVANYADDYRLSHPETERWHYVDIPYDATGYDPARDCATEIKGDCVLGEIKRDEAIAADKTVLFYDRSDAVKRLVHFIADVHQPFHAIERTVDGKPDEGGNTETVVFFDTHIKLHALWDSALISHTGRNAEDYATYLENTVLPTLPAAELAVEDPTQWAMESHDLAKTAYLDKNAHVGQEYFDAEVGPMDQRLALAGVRLAAVLEKLAAQ
jgi:hypothetical protein